MGIPFAAIADDLTGGTDLAGMLHEGGNAVVQWFGCPDPASVEEAVSAGAQVLVVSLKTRSIPAPDAVLATLEALTALRPASPAQIQFKYCSTFDSTSAGNIGPVTSSLMDALKTPFTVAVPALPVNGRTQCHGHLFVHGRLLAESPMRDHPLNPMLDSDLVRHLQRQTSRRCGLLSLPTVLKGVPAIREGLRQLQEDGVEIALVDALREEDLAAITEACRGMRLVTGGSGLGRHIRCGGGLAALPAAAPGRCLILAGSCSRATLDQLEAWERAGARVHHVSRPEQILALWDQLMKEWEADGVATVASSAPSGKREEEHAAGFEQAFAELAARAVREADVRALIVAGGETSGAVVQAAGVRSAQVASILAPGVPALISRTPPGLFLALKSGNFGGRDFFAGAVAAWRATYPGSEPI